MQTIRTVRAAISLPGILTEVLPRPLSDALSKCGAPRAEELRLHRDRYATVTCGEKNYFTDYVLRSSDMNEILKRMCGGSLYAYTDTIRQGYLTLKDGIRVGICGSAALENQKVIGVNSISGLIVRIPHPPKLTATPLTALLKEANGMGGLLIYAPPGVGKTTLLRGFALEISQGKDGKRTVAVDSREELGAMLDGLGHTLDVLSGYPREIGIEIAVRSLGAELVICDEIGSPADAEAILQAANCGVPIVATAHAASAEELLRRPSIRRLHEAEVFYAYVGIRRHPVDGFQYTIQKREEKQNDHVENVGCPSAVGSGDADRLESFPL